MSTISIKLSGVSAELVLGNYMPSDTTIFNNWEDFFHYNDLIHVSQLLTEYVSYIEISVDDKDVFKGKIPASQFKAQKSFTPGMVDRALYLRAECAEEAVYTCTFEAEDFDKNKLFFETQDYDQLFKVGNSFITNLIYDGKTLSPEWQSGKPVGNICLLCRFENGYLVPLYDAIKKIEAQ